MREELEKLIAEATPGPWEVDTIYNEDGCYSGGGGCGQGFNDYAIYAPIDGKAVQILDTSYSDDKLIEEEFDEDKKIAWDCIGKANAALIVFLVNNAPAILEALTERASMAAEIERLRADVARLREPHWFYLGDDCSSDQCRFGIDECIAEDFEWDNPPEGDHVLQITGARPVPDMWVALHYFTEEEMDQRDDDEPYTYTVHTTEEEARAALEARP